MLESQSRVSLGTRYPEWSHLHVCMSPKNMSLNTAYTERCQHISIRGGGHLGGDEISVAPFSVKRIVRKGGCSEGVVGSSSWWAWVILLPTY